MVSPVLIAKPKTPEYVFQQDVVNDIVMKLWEISVLEKANIERNLIYFDLPLESLSCSSAFYKIISYF